MPFVLGNEHDSGSLRSALFRSIPTFGTVTKRDLRSNSRIFAAIFSITLAIIVLEILAYCSLTANKSEQSTSGTVIAFHEYQHSSFNLEALRRCGSSPSEARSQGCLFDLLSFAWQAPECYDNETIAEFEAVTLWKYYRDEAGTAQVSHTEAAQGLHSFHVPWEFHRVHCLFMRRQMLRAILDGRPLDAHVAAYGHTLHCGEVILDESTPLDSMGTDTPVVFPECKALETWRVNFEER